MSSRILVSRILLAGGLALAFAAAGRAQYGLYALGSQTVTPEVPAAVESNPYVDGIALRFEWSVLEPAEGQFAWTALDSEIQSAASHGKKVSLSVVAGYGTPDWVYTAGAKPFSYIWTKPWGPPSCTVTNIPIPWDKVFLSKWGDFVTALGQRYDGNPTVTWVHVTGVNSVSQETSLPMATGGTVQVLPGKPSCTANNDVQNWIAAGYTRTLVESALHSIDTIFVAAFPSHLLGPMINPGGFPPIDQNGQLMAHATADSQVPIDMITLEYQTWGSRFFVQENGLSAHWCWQPLAALAGKVKVAYQMLSTATGDSACGMNGGVSPCDPVTVLSEAIAKGMANGAHYLEIYPGDITNSAMQPTLEAAQQSLDSGSGSGSVSRGLRTHERP
jgi:hypothetical protein